MVEYITDEAFATLIEDIQQKLDSGDVDGCKKMLADIIEDASTKEKYIDRTYMNEVKAKRRNSKIADINRMLGEMTLEQIENVHNYTADEFNEPNHEAEALEAIVKLSKKIENTSR